MRTRGGEEQMEKLMRNKLIGTQIETVTLIDCDVTLIDCESKSISVTSQFVTL